MLQHEFFKRGKIIIIIKKAEKFTDKGSCKLTETKNACSVKKTLDSTLCKRQLYYTYEKDIECNNWEKELRALSQKQDEIEIIK